MIILASILALIPGFAWLLFYLQEDLHPEPKKLIFLTFIAGMASAFFALALELLFNFATVKLGIISLNFGSLLVLALIEELMKFSAAYLVVHKSKSFDEPVDAMIYCVVAALGFATLENIGALTLGNGNQLALISTVFASASLRFVGATLLHSLTSAIIGYSWAMGIRKLNTTPHIWTGLAIATVLHSIFNYFIIKHGNIMYTAVFLLIIGFFVLSDFEELRQKKI